MDIDQPGLTIVRNGNRIVGDIACVVNYGAGRRAPAVSDVHEGLVDCDTRCERMVADCWDCDDRSCRGIGTDCDRKIVTMRIGLSRGRDEAGRHNFADLDRVGAARNRNSPEREATSFIYADRCGIVGQRDGRLFIGILHAISVGRLDNAV